MKKGEFLENLRARQELIVDVGTVADFLNISERRINQLCKAGILPRVALGHYNLKLCSVAYTRYLQSLHRDRERTITDERIELIRRDQKLKDIEIQKAAGMLLDKRSTTNLWKGIVQRTKDRLFAGVPVAVQLIRMSESDESAKNKLMEIVSEAIQELINQDPETLLIDRIPRPYRKRHPRFLKGANANN